VISEAFSCISRWHSLA